MRTARIINTVFVGVIRRLVKSYVRIWGTDNRLRAQLDIAAIVAPSLLAATMTAPAATVRFKTQAAGNGYFNRTR
jgi:hypothetical protein